MHLLVVLGTRPEAIKLFTVVEACRARGLPVRVCITNQHPDLLPDTLEALSLRADHRADIGDGPCPSLVDLQAILRRSKPDAVVVQGDTRSALAGALAAALEGVPVAHVEAGLRTTNSLSPFPEELFRRAIDRLSDTHLAPTENAVRQLIAEGMAPCRTWNSGNTIVDAFKALKNGHLASPRHILLTVHRTENDRKRVETILTAASELAAGAGCEVIHVRHPRHVDDGPILPNVRQVDPLLPQAFSELLQDARLVMTDSGGVQEEAALLARPTLVLRQETERPELLAKEFAELVPVVRDEIVRRGLALLENPGKPADASIMGGGNAGEKIVQILKDRFFSLR